MIASRALNLSRIAEKSVAGKLSLPASGILGGTDVATRTYARQSPAVRRYIKKQKTNKGEPTIAYAKAMSNDYMDMDNNSLNVIAHMNNHHACAEVLKRNIMAVDNVSYRDAEKVYHQIAAKNREGMLLAALPYYIGIVAGTGAALGSIPFVFDLGTAEWFNEYYVTTEVPEPADLETMLEVGSWTWNWMEPPLGTVSFALLCLQFSRAQLQNLGIKPFTNKLKAMRAANLARSFPRYDTGIVKAFSTSDPLIH